jgi:peptidyl-prolyl cis-trans isomerase D
MLQEIRERSGNLVIKIILSIIGASFFVVGVGDIIRLFVMTPPVAELGNIKISFQNFYSEYRQALTDARDRKEALSQKEKEFIAERTVESMLQRKVLDDEPNHLHLQLPPQAVFDHISSLPIFQKNGQFDAEAFDRIFSQMGINRQVFFDQIEGHLRQQQLLGPLTAGLKLPPFYLNLLEKIQNHKKVFEYFIAPEDNIVIEEPSETELASWLRKHQECYKIPEKRDIEILIIDHKEIETNIKIFPEDIKKEYEQRKGEWATPEKRSITTLTLPTEAEADQVKLFLMKNKSIKKLKKEYKDILPNDLGFVSRSEVPSEHADVLFGMKAKEAYGPFRTQEGHIIYFVNKIQPAGTQPFEEVNKIIEEEIIARQVGQQVNDLKEKVEDALSGGKTLKKIAKEFALRKINIEGLEAATLAARLEENGLSKEAQDQISPLVFTMDKESESDFLETKNAAFVLKVKKITPAHTPELSQVREKVLEDLKKEVKQEKVFEWCFAQIGELQMSSKEWKALLTKREVTPQLLEISRCDLQGGSNEVRNIFGEEDIAQIILHRKNAVKFYKTRDGHIAVLFLKKVKNDVQRNLNSEKAEKDASFQKDLEYEMKNETHYLTASSIMKMKKKKIHKKSIAKAIGQNED